MSRELTPSDLSRVIGRLPKQVVELLKGPRSFPLMLGGGFIRSVIAREDASDIDIFGDDTAQEVTNAAKWLVSEMDGVLVCTDNAITVVNFPRLPVQFVTRWRFLTAEEILAHFDFTVAQAVVWWDAGTQRWMSLCAKWYYEHLAGRRLVYTNQGDAGGSLLRVVKYVKRGYMIYADDLADITWRLAGGDRAEIRRKLREVDPLRIVDGVVVGAED